MALITCPECGKKISDKADVCISCGFPIKNLAKHNININECYILGKRYILPNISQIVISENWGKAFIEITDFVDKCEFDNPTKAKVLWFILEYYAKTKTEPNIISEDDLNFKIADKNTSLIQRSFKSACEEIKNNNHVGIQSNNPIHCPNCGSTNVKKISATKRLFSAELFGLASSSIGKQFQCMEKNCGYKW